MNILEDLPHEIEYINPKSYLDCFFFSESYNDFTTGMMEFLNKFIDANEKTLFECNKENLILNYEFREFIKFVKNKSIKET